MDGWKNGWMNGYMENGLVDRWMDKLMDGKTDRHKARYIFIQYTHTNAKHPITQYNVQFL